MLQNKKILLGVSGGIAAYKIAFLVRLLIKEGALVKVVMTPSATQFIGPVTLATLSKNKVVTALVDEDNNDWNNHVELALWCDLMLIAPATSNTIAKMANGICDNALLATYLSAKSPVFIAPAMDLDMAEHPTLEKNIQTLVSNGVKVIPFEDGELASGLMGKGRMAEVESLMAKLDDFFSTPLPLKGTKFLVNAGPTYEAIDPVRFIGNRSTGKMGVAIANELVSKGSEVVLVLGPSHVEHEIFNAIEVIRVESAEDMAKECTAVFASCTGAVLTAAVADYKPRATSDQKIKKASNNLSLELVKTTDILLSLGQIKKEKQLLIGFALETENEVDNAKEKLVRKHLDIIILNSLNDKGAGFGHDTNKITAIFKSGEVRTFGLKKKTEVAGDIVNLITEVLNP